MIIMLTRSTSINVPKFSAAVTCSYWSQTRFAGVATLLIAMIFGAILTVFDQQKSVLANHQEIQAVEANARTFALSPPLGATTAKEEEIVIVVANFVGLKSSNQGAENPNAQPFEVAAQDYNNVRVVSVTDTLRNREDALIVAETYEASIVFFGELVAQKNKTVSAWTHVELFADMDNQQERFTLSTLLFVLDLEQDGAYVMSFSLGQLSLIQNDLETALEFYVIAAGELDVNRASDLSGALLFTLSGNIHVLFGEVKLALANYERAIEVDPDFPFSYFNRALLYHRELGDLDLALSDLNQTIELAPDFANAFHNRGHMYEHMGEIDLALADYDQAIELDPTNAVAYYNRGHLYHEIIGDEELALPDYSRAIELDPTFADAYNNRGNIYRYANEPQLALADFNKAIELEPTHAIAFYNRANVYYDLNEFDLALEDYNKAIELDPTHAYNYWGRGISYHKLGQFEEAIHDFHTYEQLTGQLEPFMVDLIAEMELALTPAVVPSPTRPPEAVDNPTFPAGSTVTVPGVGPLMTRDAAGSFGIGAVCINGTEATVIQTVQIPNGQIWVEIDCGTGTGWIEEEDLMK